MCLGRRSDLLGEFGLRLWSEKDYNPEVIKNQNHYILINKRFRNITERVTTYSATNDLNMKLKQIQKDYQKDINTYWQKIKKIIHVTNQQQLGLIEGIMKNLCMNNEILSKMEKNVSLKIT